ncbi:MAG: hypothetical protein WDW38_003873, partial [Sanguina aurantia]
MSNVCSLSPEELYLCCVAALLIAPQAATITPAANRKGRRALMVLLLREIRGNCSTSTFPSLAQMCSKLQQQLGTFAPPFTTLLQDLLKAAGFDPSSPIGLFLRRCRATFLLMPFEGVVRLFNALQSDLQAQLQLVSGSSHAAAHNTCSDRGAASSTGLWRSGLRDDSSLERVLAEQQRNCLQQGPSVPACQLDALLDEIASSASSARGGLELPRATYVRLCNAIQHRDFTTALDQLHRYYDNSQSASDKSKGGLGTLAGQDRGLHQNALLSLCNLHAEFGHTHSAIQALVETLRMAQQASDSQGQAHALAAMCSLFGGVAPGSPGLPEDSLASVKLGSHHLQLLRLLHRLHGEARRLVLPHLSAYASVSLASFSLQHSLQCSDGSLQVPLSPKGPSTGLQTPGAAGTPAAGTAGVSTPLALEDATPAPPTIHVSASLRYVSRLQLQSALSAAAPTSQSAIPGTFASSTSSRGLMGGELYSGPILFDTSRPGMAGACSAAVQPCAGAAHLVLSAAWRVQGGAVLAHTHALMHLACYSDTASRDERATAFAQLAQVTHERRGPDAAAAVLEAAAHAFPLVQPKAIAVVQGTVQHATMLATGQLAAAERCSADVLSAAEPASHLDVRIRLQSQHLVVQGLTASGDLARAFAAATDLFANSTHAGLQYEAMQALLLLSEVHLAANDPMGALQYSLACRLHARELHHDILAAQAAVSVACCWLALSPSNLPEIISMLQ